MRNPGIPMLTAVPMAVFISTIILLGTGLSAANAQTTSLTVKTDKPSYTTGDTINVTGNVGTVQSGQPVLIQVYNEKNSPARVDQVTPDANGTYTYSFKAGGPYFANSGTYSIKATYAGQSSTATFSFTSTAATVEVWKNANVTIAGKSYQIRYQITGGSLTGLSANPNHMTLTANITTTSNGTLKIELPTNVIDAKGKDFAVHVDGANPTGTLNDTASGTARILTIGFDKGASQIEITGTFMVPEFGFIAAIVLAMSIVGVIVATRYSGKFQGLPSSK